MQDRFKYRHWDKRINKMFYPERNDNFSYYVNNSDIIETMQCTGLKDKNGKLIYEEDLLKPLGEYDERVEVVWDGENARFCLMIERTDPCYWNGLYEENRKGRDYYDFDEFYVKDFEVIGNIYENPELSKGEK